MVQPWRTNPILYEINTWAWLHALSVAHDRPITLGTVPDSELDALAAWGFDAVWLMGVWERSPAGRYIALEHPDLQAEYRRILPDFTPDDVAGSPYAVHRYVVDEHLGGPDELADFRARLAARGLRLILDFVPNHVAVDHPCVAQAPDCLVQGSERDLAVDPDLFFRGPAGHVLAHGRDPYFPPWSDTAQVNAFSPALREHAAMTLLEIASQCDGVRCDMAMLVTNRVFLQTWGEHIEHVPEAEYWEVMIPSVRNAHPHFLFLAEVYWDMEWELIQQGFDFAYDKRLYDRLVNGTVHAIADHLRADHGYQQHMIHFIENHDERRAAEALGPGRDLAAAVLIATLPGATLLHEGQLVGHHIKLPVQLARRPQEADNAQVRAFYDCLLREVGQPVYHDGTWQLCEPLPAWDLNASHRHLIAYTWRHGEARRLVVINYSAASAQGRIQLPALELAGRTWTLTDVLHGATYERNGDEMTTEGLYIDLKPWSMHVFDFG